MKKLLLIFIVIISFFPWKISAEEPNPFPSFYRYTNLTWPHPFNYPCDSFTRNGLYKDTENGEEFHPLRPYPGNPCDELIPQEHPEAAKNKSPKFYKKFITFQCNPSLNVAGIYRVKDVIEICGMPTLPDPLNVLSLTYDADGNSPMFLCDPTVGPDICQVKKIVWDVHIDLDAANLPFMGNTELELPDAVKVNEYLDWYLNGTKFQSSKTVLDVSDPQDNRKISTFSGPVNKLIALDLRNRLKYKSTKKNWGRNMEWHNYWVTCAREFNKKFQNCINGTKWRLNHVALVGDQNRDPWVWKYVNYSSLEDTPSEVTMSTILKAQPKTPEIDGEIELIYLTLNWGTDSRIYFSHLESIEAMTELLNAFHTPITTPFPTRVMPTPVPEGTSCERDLNAQCTKSNTCAHGAPLVSSDCTEAGFLCCPSSSPPGTDCQDDLGGHCIPAACANGAPLHSSDCGPFPLQCCPDVPNIGTSCERDLGGKCGLASACTSGDIIISSDCNTPFFACCQPPPARTDETTPPWYYYPQWMGQIVKKHQGINDGVEIEGEDYRNPGVPIFDPLQIARVYRQGFLIRNTEMMEGSRAPAALYDNIPDAYHCDPIETYTNPGDSLLGHNLKARLTYYQLFQWVPTREIAPCSGQGSCPANVVIAQSNTTTAPSCISQSCVATENGECGSAEVGAGTGCCWGVCPYMSPCIHADANYYCSPTTACQNGDDEPKPYSCDPKPGGHCCGPGPQGDCKNISGTSSLVKCGQLNKTDCLAEPLNCDWTDRPYVEHPNPPHCPVWPYRDLRSAAIVNPFTKNPLVEKIYDLLVINPQSLLRRWLPKLPLNSSESASLAENSCQNVPNTPASVTCSKYTTESDCKTLSFGYCAWQPANVGNCQNLPDAPPTVACSKYTTESDCKILSLGYCEWQEPNTIGGLKAGREGTIPGKVPIVYGGFTDDLTDTQVTGGLGGGNGALLFTYLGSMADYILGRTNQENYNLQRMLRPWTPQLVSSTTGVNCVPNIPVDTAALGLCSVDSFADAALSWAGGVGPNYAKECYGDVVKRAAAAGVDAGFAIWIWLHESAASNYTAYPGVEDFGVHGGGVPVMNFSEQIDFFLKLPAAYAAKCGKSDMHTFVSEFYMGVCDSSDPKVAAYEAGMISTWNIVSCGRPLPSYP
jgi:hypothetical protein